MSRSKSKTPTESEMRIMNVAWDLGRVTIRQVYDVVRGTTHVGYNAVGNAMRAMVDRGMLGVAGKTKDGVVYMAIIDKDETYAARLRELANNGYGGSMAALVNKAVLTKWVDPTEVEEIKALVKKRPEDMP